ncbi:hypothetical protein DNTS_021193, partial [Danionella cerebrum]
MYEWFDGGDFLSMVMEYPQPCMSLKEFIDIENGLSANTARLIMRQLVNTVQHCISRGVFHNNINLRNILVNIDLIPKIKLIDFSSARLVDEDGYDSRTYDGDVHFQPPEAFGDGKYYPVPTNVWFLSIILATMLTGHLPFRLVKDIFIRPISGLESILRRCQDLITKCLERNPEDRPTLEEIILHRWMIFRPSWMFRRVDGGRANSTEMPLRRTDKPAILEEATPSGSAATGTTTSSEKEELQDLLKAFLNQQQQREERLEKESQRQEICCIHGDEREYPCADLNLEIAGQTYCLNVCVAESAPYPVILGKDVPVLVDLMQTYPQNAFVVTRSQQKVLLDLTFENFDFPVPRADKPRKSCQDKRRSKVRGTKLVDALTPPVLDETEILPRDLKSLQQADLSLK